MQSPYVGLIDVIIFLYLYNFRETFNNFLMAFLSVHTLVRLETDPELSAALAKIYQGKMWTWPDHDYPASEQMNPVFTFLYAGGLAANSADTELAAAVEAAVCNLKHFPGSKAGMTNPAGDPDLEVCKSRGGHPRAAEPFTADQRYIDNFLWRLDPYEIPKQSEGRKKKVGRKEEERRKEGEGR